MIYLFIIFNKITKQKTMVINKGMENIKVREPQLPVEGEYTLCNKGEVAVYRNGEWVRPN